ncbi:MAG TPA: hypothetical protein VD794_16740 [Flavisolibacter sp.]|nr:hypothetical protein [Flavisolibacter sp.]
MKPKHVWINGCLAMLSESIWLPATPNETALLYKRRAVFQYEPNAVIS